MSEYESSTSLSKNMKAKLESITKEWVGVNYLLFTSSRLITSLSLIFFAGIASFFISPNDPIVIESDVENVQFDLIQDYVIGLNLALVVAIMYYIAYLWTVIHENGDYGYWISLGVKRDKFFIITSITLFLSLFFGILFSYIVLITVGGIKFAFQTNVAILLLFLAYITLLTGIIWILTEMIQKKDIVVTIIIILYGIGSLAFRDENHIFSDILIPTYHLEDYNLIFNFIIPLTIGSALIYGSYKLNLKREIEI